MSPLPVSDLAALQDQISADPIPNSTLNSDTFPNANEQHFRSRLHPSGLNEGNPIAYGGNTIALAVHSAYQTLPSDPRTPLHLYSIQGTFLGGTRVDRPLNLTVTPTRNTRTFATRHITASQVLDDGTSRTCATFTCDFHAREADFLKWSAQPDLPEILSDGPLHSTRTHTSADILDGLVKDGHVSDAEANRHRTVFRVAEHYLDMRHAYPSVSGANLLGLAPWLPTPQDDLPVTKRTSYEWIRIRPPFPRSTSSASSSQSTPFSGLDDEAEPLHMSGLAFLMDQALHMVGLNHDHKTFLDATACSTLEFALRVFVPVVRMDKWHLRERKTISAGGGRTFSEGRLWTGDGELVCNMSQVCILRGPSKRGKGVDGNKDGKDVKSKM